MSNRGTQIKLEFSVLGDSATAVTAALKAINEAYADTVDWHRIRTNQTVTFQVAPTRERQSDT